MADANDIAQYLASLPPDANPFTALRDLARQQLTPKTSHWVYDVSAAQSAILAVTLILISAGFVVRWRRGTLWFFRRATLPSGELICPHPVNGFALFCIPFLVLAQAEIWCTVHNLKASKAGEVEPWLRGLMLQLYYIPLFLAGFADCAGAVTNVVCARFRKTSTLPRWLSVRLIHIVIYFFPLLLLVGLVVAFAFFGIATQKLISVYHVLDGHLATYEASWTGGSPLAALLALQEDNEATDVASNAFIASTQALFAYTAVVTIALWIIWLPATLSQAFELHRQIYYLKQTAKHERRISQEEAVLSMRSGLTPTRIISAFGLTGSVAYYVFLAVWFAVNPARMLSSTFVADFFTIGLLCGVCLIAVPVVVLFFIRSFDKPAGQPLATTLTPTEAAAGRSKHLTPRATVVSFRRSAGEQVRTPLEIHVDIEAATRVDVDTGEEIKEKM